MSSVADRERSCRILFVTERWCDARPECGLTNSFYNLFGSFRAAGWGRAATFHLDAYERLFRRRGDRGFRAVGLRLRPSAIVWTPGPTRPPEDLPRVREALGIPVVVIWHDSVFPSNLATAQESLSWTDLHIPLDSSTAFEGRVSRPERFFPRWTPQDPLVFHDAGLDRDIDVSFVGSIEGYRDRQAAIEVLRRAGIEVRCRGGQRAEGLAIGLYARLLQRSKITLNFSAVAESARAGAVVHQVKGRVFEAAACGALLLESRNDETPRWLRCDGGEEEYVPFDGPDDLVEKVRKYLADEEARRAIAARAVRAMEGRLHARAFWGSVFARLGLAA